jgi:hypothetical protein
MTIIAYRPVATVSAREKGAATPWAGVRFWPTPATAERLAKQRMVFRPFPGGFRLAAEHDLAGSGGPTIPIAGDLGLLFAVRLDGALGETDATRKSGPSLFLSNRNASGTPQSGPQLSREEIVGLKDRAWIVPRRHRAGFPLGPGNRPNRIELKSYFGGSAGEPLPIEAPAEAEAAEVMVALEMADGVAFVLRPKPQGAERLIVADDELAEMRPDGALELVLKAFPGPDPAAGREFTAIFER